VTAEGSRTDRDGLRVIDFGIARLIDTTGTTGAVTGTPPYMAPEHFLGGRVVQ
jgi:eukaryotic-like serine/threonine-protein kinase